MQPLVFRVVRYASEWKATVAFLWLLGGIFSSSGQQYVEIQGILNIDSFASRNAKGIALVPVEFTCVVSTNEWKLAVNCTENTDESYRYDGTNVYQILHPIRPPSTERLAEISKNGISSAPYVSNLYSIYIAESPSGGLRGFNYMQNGIPWLAFCSGKYLKQAGRILPMPTAYLPRDYLGFAYADKTQQFADELGLPQKVELFTSRVREMTSLTNDCLSVKRRLDGKRIHYTPTVPDGIRVFQYTVAGSTNFRGWNIPLRFEFSKDDLDTNQQWFCAYAGTGQVTSIRSVDRLENIFSTEVRQTVVDLRFRSDVKPVEGIIYPWTNAFLPSTNDAELQKRFARKVARTPLYQPELRKNARRSTIGFVLMTTLALPFVVIVILRLNNAKHRKLKSYE